MPATNLMRLSVEITNRSQDGAADRYGQPVWADESPFVTVCHVHFLSSVDLDDRAAGRVNAVGYFPAGTDIRQHAKVVLAYGWQGEVVGPARPQFRALDGTASHLEVDLAGVE